MLVCLFELVIVCLIFLVIFLGFLSKLIKLLGLVFDLDILCFGF